MAMQIQLTIGFNGTLSGGVRCSPCSPDVLYCCHSQVVLLDTLSGGQRYLRGHDDRITAFDVSPSGWMAATGQCGLNADVLLWDLTTGNIKSRFQEHDIEVCQLSFSMDDRLLLSIGHERDSKIFVLDTTTGKIVTKQMLPAKKRATASAFAPAQGTSYIFAVGTQDGDIHIFSLDPFSGLIEGTKVTSGSLRRCFTSMVFSSDGLWLYAGTASGDVVTINVTRRTMQLVHPACTAGVGALRLTPSGRLLVGGGSGSLSLFSNDHMWKHIQPFASIPGPITSVSSNGDGTALIVGTATGGIFRIPSGSSGAASVYPLQLAHFGPIHGIAAASQDPSCVVTCSDDGTVCTWSLSHPQLAPFTQLHLARSDSPLSGSALSVALSADTIISGWADGNIRGHVRGGPSAAAWVIPGAHALSHATGVTAMKLSNRSGFLLTGGAGGEVRCWDMRTRQMASNLKGAIKGAHSGAISDLHVMADDSHVISASLDRSWSLWDLHPECCRASWRVKSIINGMAVCPDQMTVVTVGQDRQAMIWDIRSPNVVRTLPNIHEGEPGCVAVNPSGSAFATGGADGLVKLWDLQSGALIGAGACHSANVSKIVFPQAEGPDQPIVSVALDGSMALSHMPAL